jgi:hypothetical protein
LAVKPSPDDYWTKLGLQYLDVMKRLDVHYIEAASIMKLKPLEMVENIKNIIDENRNLKASTLICDNKEEVAVVNGDNLVNAMHGKNIYTDELENNEIIICGEEINNKPVMRRLIDEYEDRQKKYYLNFFRNEVEKVWLKLAPTQNSIELEKVVEQIMSHSFTTMGNVMNIILKNFQDAYDCRNKNGRIQFGSILITEYCTLKEFRKVSRRPIDFEFMRTLKFHNYHVGSGLPIPIEFINKRNQEHRGEVIKALVQFCQDRGQRTAKVRKMKDYLQPIPVVYRTQSI